MQERQRRVKGEDAGGDADGNRQDVAGQQGGRRDQGRPRAKIVLTDDVGAATLGIGLDRLAIGNRDDREQEGDREGDGQGQRQCPGAGQDQDPQDLLGGIRRRRERVRGEDRERLRLRYPLVDEPGAGQRRPDQDPPQALIEPPGRAARDEGVLARDQCVRPGLTEGLVERPMDPDVTLARHVSLANFADVDGRDRAGGVCGLVFFAVRPCSRGGPGALCPAVLTVCGRHFGSSPRSAIASLRRVSHCRHGVVQISIAGWGAFTGFA